MKFMATFNNSQKLIAGILFFLILQGCSTVPSGTQILLPQQNFSAQAPEGHTKVILYNTTNKVMWPASHRIIAGFNSELTPEIPSGNYVILYLLPGSYEFTLTHWDVFNFSDTYEFEIPHGELYVRIFNGSTSTKFEVVDKLPEEFESEFLPLYKCCS